MGLRDLDFSALSGRLDYDASLAPHSWFRVGGKADLLFTADDEADATKSDK